MSAEKWRDLLTEPDTFADDAAPAAWFAKIAERMLCGTRVMVGMTALRFTEIEFYYHADAHTDVFTHRDPVQKSLGRWYFHRTAGVYRGGSFKGVDLTFGGDRAFGGVLIRGVEQDGGPLVDGPSLTVDHLLRLSGKATVAELDAAIDGRAAWEEASPVRLVWREELEPREVLQTARVGLSLKRLRKSDVPPRFILRPYRYLSEPRKISKGKQHMALALHRQGLELAAIRERCGCTAAALQRYIADYAEGGAEEAFDAYFGAEMGPKDLSRLHGLWAKRFGKPSA